ncbi:hypothetical protein CAPTEDRAFT_192210 [Capitella teleta]|uniref:C-type lectin domain-containing protein n=1 Tax=Capitella teleta TaxID=283909 RepID=R7TPG7_CAPTE|nr:hypothetical protein CAPTEDRAFT_192210 [Capitella teleta]|eukprot:ELT95778.1 hypothetical protein CAPTEDRAFT_192210 [Capitella teleta]
MMTISYDIWLRVAQILGRDDFLDWEGARDKCSSNGLDLLVIETEEERQFITQMVEEETGLFFDVWVAAFFRDAIVWGLPGGLAVSTSLWTKNQPTDTGTYA